MNSRPDPQKAIYLKPQQLALERRGKQPLPPIKLRSCPLSWPRFMAATLALALVSSSRLERPGSRRLTDWI
jgi:hypothetical protein